MKLGEYLKDNGLLMADFGKKIGRSQAAVSRICAGEQPRPDAALKIVRVTKGAVSLADLYGLEEKYRCVGCGK